MILSLIEMYTWLVGVSYFVVFWLVDVATTELTVHYTISFSFFVNKPWALISRCDPCYSFLALWMWPQLMPYYIIIFFFLVNKSDTQDLNEWMVANKNAYWFNLVAKWHDTYSLKSLMNFKQNAWLHWLDESWIIIAFKLFFQPFSGLISLPKC